MVAQDATQFQDLLRLQTAIVARVVLDDPSGNFLSIGAVAQSFSNDVVFSSAVVVDALMNVIEESIASAKVTMPYIAGLLFFREGPAAIAALKELRAKLDVLIVHGRGINHPRFAGFALHLGVVLNAPTIGVSKTMLCGEYVERDQACHCVPLKFRGTARFRLKNDDWNQTDLYKSRPPHFAAIRTASRPTMCNKPQITRATAFSSHQSATS